MADKFWVWCKDCYETMRENLNNEYGKRNWYFNNLSRIMKYDKPFTSDLVDERVVGWIRNELIEKIEKESTSIITDGCFLSSLSSHTKEAISKYTKEAVDTAVLETRRNIIKELTAMLNNSQTTVETLIKARIEKEFNTNIKALIQQAIKAELKSYFTQGE